MYRPIVLFLNGDGLVFNRNFTTPEQEQKWREEIRRDGVRVMFAGQPAGHVPPEQIEAMVCARVAIG